MTFTAAALTLAWVVIVMLVLVTAGLLRLVAGLRDAAVRPAGLDVRDLSGFGLPSSGPLAAVRPAGGGIVLFSSPSCATCADVLADLVPAVTAERLVVVSLGDCAGAAAAAPGSRCIPAAGEVLDRLGVPGTPFLMSVDAAGTITSTLLPGSSEELRTWLARALPIPKGHQ